MRSKWVTYKDHKIFYQDFSGHDLLESEAVKKELEEVQAVVMREPPASMLVLSDFRETQVGKDLIDLMVASSSATKSHIKKTAVVGITGAKRFVANMLISVTGQQLSLFDNIEQAEEWLIQ
jgi:hypothetical protein